MGRTLCGSRWADRSSIAPRTIRIIGALQGSDGVWGLAVEARSPSSGWPCKPLAQKPHLPRRPCQNGGVVAVAGSAVYRRLWPPGSNLRVAEPSTILRMAQLTEGARRSSAASGNGSRTMVRLCCRPEESARGQRSTRAIAFHSAAVRQRWGVGRSFLADWSSKHVRRRSDAAGGCRLQRLAHHFRSPGDQYFGEIAAEGAQPGRC